MDLPEDLHTAIGQGQIGILGAFLKSENADVISPNPHGKSLLHTACAHGRMEIIDLLTIYNAPYNIRDKNGDTPLHVAVKKGNYDVVLILLFRGAALDLADCHSYTPLHSAAMKGLANIVQLLIGFGADVNVSSIDKNRPIHMAASKNQFQVLIQLLEAGADTDVQNSIGYTAMHIAILNGYKECMIALLACGADFNTLKDINGDSALNLAEKGDSKYFKNLFNAIQVQRMSVIQEVTSGVIVKDVRKLMHKIQVHAVNIRNVHDNYQRVIYKKTKEITDKADAEIEEWKKINPQVEQILIKQPQVQAPISRPSSPFLRRLSPISESSSSSSGSGSPPSRPGSPTSRSRSPSPTSRPSSPSPRPSSEPLHTHPKEEFLESVDIPPKKRKTTEMEPPELD